MTVDKRHMANISGKIKVGFKLVHALEAKKYGSFEF